MKSTIKPGNCVSNGLAIPNTFLPQHPPLEDLPQLHNRNTTTQQNGASPGLPGALAPARPRSGVAGRRDRYGGRDGRVKQKGNRCQASAARYAVITSVPFPRLGHRNTKDPEAAGMTGSDAGRSSSAGRRRRAAPCKPLSHAGAGRRQAPPPARKSSLRRRRRCPAPAWPAATLRAEGPGGRRPPGKTAGSPAGRPGHPPLT